MVQVCSAFHDEHLNGNSQPREHFIRMEKRAQQHKQTLIPTHRRKHHGLIASTTHVVSVCSDPRPIKVSFCSQSASEKLIISKAAGRSKASKTVGDQNSLRVYTFACTCKAVPSHQSYGRSLDGTSAQAQPGSEWRSQTSMVTPCGNGSIRKSLLSRHICSQIDNG
jgi:hypothetical protein